jgi:Fe-S-cluster-containing dehydrogenase component
VAKYQIQIFEERCTGCMRCALACSDLYSGSFNPAASRIWIAVSDHDWAVELTEDCNECAACVDHCFYDALQRKKRGVEA